MTKRTHRWTAVMLLVIALASLAPMAGAHASAKGTRNTAIAVSGVAAYFLLRGRWVPGIATAGAAAYAWSRYHSAHVRERRQAGFYGTRPYRVAGYRSAPARHVRHRR